MQLPGANTLPATTLERDRTPDDARANVKWIEE
jgi:cytochrome c5